MGAHDALPYLYAASHGHPLAHWRLGEIYLEGGERSLLRAYKWFDLAFRAERQTAQRKCKDILLLMSRKQIARLGSFYETKGELAKAFRLFRNAARKGLPWAQFHLGLCYEKGLGIERNQEQAIKWFSEAAKQGVRRARTKLVRYGIENL